MNDQTIIIIPARYQSSRFPGKPLAEINGKPMIEHVVRRASQAKVDRVIVATDDERIHRTVLRFGGESQMTSPSHQSGTDRVAEVAKSLHDAQIIVNVQGDEPLIDPRAIEQAIAPLQQDRSIPVGTLRNRISSEDELTNPNVVKVVCDNKGYALYFSRSPIPFHRATQNNLSHSFKHVGLYVYQRDFLTQIESMKQTPLELVEGLEQLRFLSYGHRIICTETEYQSMGVDTPDQIEQVCQSLGEAGVTS